MNWCNVSYLCYCFHNICIHKQLDNFFSSWTDAIPMSIKLMLQRFNKQLILNAKYFSCFFRWGKCQWSKHDVPLLLGFASFPLWRRTRSGLVTSQLHRHSDPELTILLGNWNENNYKNRIHRSLQKTNNCPHFIKIHRIVCIKQA